MSRFGFTPETFNVNAASSLSHEGPVFNDFRQLYETLNLSSFGRCKSKSSKKMSSVKFGDLSSDSDSDDDDMDFGRAASKRVALKKTKKMSFGDLSSDSYSDDDDMDFGRVKKTSSKAAEKITKKASSKAAEKITKKVATKKTKKASSDSDDEETDFGRVKKTSSKTAKKITKKVATKKTKKASSDDEEMDFGKTAFGKKLRIVKNQAQKAMALHRENGITLKKAWAIVKKSK